jgi:hypothetical protein
VKPIPWFIDQGFPETSDSSSDTYVTFAVPDTSNAPAYAEVATKDPANAVNPSFFHICHN